MSSSDPNDNTEEAPPVGIKRTETVLSRDSGSPILPEDSVSQRGFRSLASSADSERFVRLRRPDTNLTRLETLDDAYEGDEVADPDESDLDPRKPDRHYWWVKGRRYSSSAVESGSDGLDSSEEDERAGESDEEKAETTQSSPRERSRSPDETAQSPTQ